MKPKIKITDHQDLLKLAEQHGLKPASSLQAICRAVHNSEGEDNEQASCTIRIHTGMISMSYIQVPAMFARSIKSYYPHVRAYVEEDYMVIRATLEHQPKTFLARAQAALEEDDEFISPLRMIPDSYAERPSVLASILSKKMRVTVCNDCKTAGKIRWYVAA